MPSKLKIGDKISVIIKNPPYYAAGDTGIVCYTYSVSTQIYVSIVLDKSKLVICLKQEECKW